MARKPKDITGQKFRMLTALYPTKERGRHGSIKWMCRCDCGNEVLVDCEDLLFSLQVSCGCLKAEDIKRMEEKLTHVSGTTIDFLKSSKARKESTVGIKGVFYVSSKARYVAQIMFQGKKYYLGSDTDPQIAAMYRAQAEEELIKPFLEYYEEYSRIAEKDPEWAKENPILTDVKHLGGPRFSISIKPDLKGINK